MKVIMKTAATQGISITETRSQHNRLFSKAVQRTPPTSGPNFPKIASIQAEIKPVKEFIIPCINQAIKTIAADLAETREKITHFNIRKYCGEVHRHRDNGSLRRYYHHPKRARYKNQPSSSVMSSTIDLIISSSSIALNAYTSLGPFSGSDHFPIIATLNTDPIRSSSKPPSWILPKAKWASLNGDLTQLLVSISFKCLTAPK
ncbi:hypothetical protein DAPPUDRAFT_116802 [Daphnia pulex]|uniref:Endonuclease/exonuclease/phosphatase domain-containing protein n=1 Tax=Daphnia pulex TaxID=6669 RepID=E9HQK1_DAPPU|nr:hypothetical protein DAPPUDRAFT_116802 [Daphnia pulex]|eukprot:EFX65982.1 hypothetical protein DAPPUDRAFT_116802 [Daphnia pulex]